MSSQWKILQLAALKWWDDNALRLSASLSYYTVFSLAPLLIIIMAVAGMVFGPDAVEGRLMEEIQGLVGRDSAVAIQSMIQQARQPHENRMAATLGLLAMVILSTGVFVELQDALNLIWRIKPQGTSTLRRILEGRVLSFLLVLGIGFLLVVSLTWSAVVSAVGRFFTGLLPGPELLLHGISALVSLGLFTLLFAMMFKILPDAFIAWRHVGMGALVTAVLFTIGKAGIGLYLGKTGLASAYGAASSLAVILLWVYYSSLILFFGAEYTYVTARQADAAGAKGAERRSQQRRSADRKPEEHTQRAGEPNPSAVVKA